MYTVLLVIHAMVTVSLIGIILVQRNAGDGMGLSGSSSTSFMSGRAAATFVTRATSALAAVFILSSLGLGMLTAHNHVTGASIMDKLENNDVKAASQPKKEPAKPTVPRPE